MEKVKKLFSGKLSYSIFWGYNLIFSIFLILVFSNILSSSDRPTLTEILTFGHAPANTLLMVYIFFLTPFITMALGFFTKLRNQPQSLIRLFFGFQIPLMGLAIIRIIFLRQLTPIVWIFFLSIMASVVGLLIHLLYPKVTSKLKETFLMLSQQIGLLLTSYAFLLAFFFLPIIIAFALKDYINIRDMLRGLGDTLVHGGILMFLLTLFAMMLFLLTASFFTLGPIGAFVTFWKTCSSLYKQLIKTHGLNYARLTRYGMSFIFILVVVLLSIQANGNRYTNLLSQYRNASTFEEGQKVAQQLLNRETEIKENLVSSYLAQYRFLSDNSMNILQTGYKNELGANEPTAKFIQIMFNNIALPFVYRGAFEEDIKKSAENYKEIFDNSIQKGELDTIANTLKATNTQDELKAGILDLNKKSVKIVNKIVNVTPYNDGLLAKVTIEEEYENTTDQPQEVYYEFSLSDDAVLTELTLGPDLEFGANAADKPTIPTPQSQSSQPQSSILPTPTPKMVDDAVVAPKGAANITYEQQIFDRRDPALLEQAGPRQYKLRVFPIPVKPQTQDGRRQFGNAEFISEKNQKVRYSYVTAINPQGIPLPILQEQRNVLSSSNVKYTFDGKEALITADNQHIAITSQPCPTSSLSTLISNGQVVFVPHANNAKLAGLYSCQDHFSKTDQTIQGQRIALLLDSSYSNKQKDWTEYLKKNFPIDSLLTNNTVDLFFFNDKVSQKISLNSNLLNQGLNTIPIGKTDRLGALAQIPNTYDAIFMTTDSSSFDGKPGNVSMTSKARIYLIHPENHIPIYNDALSTAIFQSGGKVVGSGFEAVQDLWLQKKMKEIVPEETILDVNEYGAWILQSKPNIKNDSGSPFNQLAQKKLIIDMIKKTSSLNLEELDRLNSLSQSSFIVTPYSSMIVLVTEDQKRQLAEAMQANNRYQVAFDIGEEQLADPSGRGILEVGAVPEPYEWLLIIVGSMLLCYFYREKFQLVLQPIYEQSIRKTKKF